MSYNTGGSPATNQRLATLHRIQPHISKRNSANLEILSPLNPLKHFLPLEIHNRSPPKYFNLLQLDTCQKQSFNGRLHWKTGSPLENLHKGAQADVTLDRIGLGSTLLECCP